MNHLLFEELEDITQIDSINESKTSKKDQKHRCLNGKLVNFFSQKCLDDIQKRIDDALHYRDTSSSRSDTRLHYNGLLNVLRRKQREVKKFLDSQASAIGPKDSVQSKKRSLITTEQRILRLSGLI